MKLGQFCKREVTCFEHSADIAAASQLMRERHVGFLVVFKEGDALRKPIGVLTDRDIVLQVTARLIDPRAVTAADVMTPEPMIARSDDELDDLVQAMHIAGIRRVPIVDERGALSGIVALDDVIGVLASLLNSLAGSIKNQQFREWSARRG